MMRSGYLVNDVLPSSQHKPHAFFLIPPIANHFRIHVRVGFNDRMRTWGVTLDVRVDQPQAKADV